MTQTFEAWMKQVNSCLERRIGLSSDDLSDCCYYDWYEDDTTPARAASMALESNGF